MSEKAFSKIFFLFAPPPLFLLQSNIHNDNLYQIFTPHRDTMDLTSAQFMALPQTTLNTSRSIARELAHKLYASARYTESATVASIRDLWEYFPGLWAEGIAHQSAPIIDWSQVPCVANAMVQGANTFDDQVFLTAFFTMVKFATKLKLKPPKSPADSEYLGDVGGPEDQADAYEDLSEVEIETESETEDE